MFVYGFEIVTQKREDGTSIVYFTGFKVFVYARHENTDPSWNLFISNVTPVPSQNNLAKGRRTRDLHHDKSAKEKSACRRLLSYICALSCLLFAKYPNCSND